MQRFPVITNNDNATVSRHCEERSNPGANQDIWIASQARNDGTSGLLRRLAMTRHLDCFAGSQ